MSLGTGAFLIFCISTIAVSLISCAKRPSGRFWFLIAALSVPVLLANGLYWSVAWQHTDPIVFGEYEMWAPMFIVPWSIAGAIPSTLAVLFIRRSPPSAQLPRKPK
ncbi:MAG: hypothetical protein ABSD72_02990 [Terracidiphilus sp.]|jgi:hypothetical protein